MDTKQEDILSDAYQTWRIHPITAALVNGLKRHREKFISAIAKASLEDDPNPLKLRRLSIGISDLDTFATMITDYDVFCKLVK